MEVKVDALEKLADQEMRSGRNSYGKGPEVAMEASRSGNALWPEQPPLRAADPAEASRSGNALWPELQIHFGPGQLRS